MIRSPDDAKVKQKMLFASSKDALRRALVGLAVEIQGSDYSEVAYESCTSFSLAYIIHIYFLGFRLTITIQPSIAVC